MTSEGAGTSGEAELAISCRGVTKRFGQITALDSLDLSVRRGRVTGYLGPNGAGKSTTIRILLDLARPDAGDVRVLGADPRSDGPGLRRRIGYLPGELRLDERLTVDQTLRSWDRLRGGDTDPGYVDDLCRRLGLDRSRHTKGLSSGNRRKVGLVGAFMSRPDLLVLDEPTSGVDPLVQATFQELVEETLAEGRTVFLSSHVLSEVQSQTTSSSCGRVGWSPPATSPSSAVRPASRSTSGSTARCRPRSSGPRPACTTSRSRGPRCAVRSKGRPPRCCRCWPAARSTTSSCPSPTWRTRSSYYRPTQEGP